MNVKTTRERLKARARMNYAVRAYFNGEGFVEVTTTAALRFPNLDPNVKPVWFSPGSICAADGGLWLHTSPELSMKKLVAEGSGDIFQICQVFRDESPSPIHNFEFTMLEWYRTGADYRDAVKDTVNVLLAVCQAVCGKTTVTRDGVEFNMEGPWEEISMAEAFTRFAGTSSFERPHLVDALEKRGYAGLEEESLEDLFFRLFVDAVEPMLGKFRPTVIRDFPAFLGTMAKPAESDPSILERFEIYVGGLELANGFTELTDTVDLRGRMKKVLESFQDSGLPDLSIDEEFIQAAGGLGQCAGVSVGLDRLAMLVMEAEDISQVMFPCRSEDRG